MEHNTEAFQFARAFKLLREISEILTDIERQIEEREVEEAA